MMTDRDAMLTERRAMIRANFHAFQEMSAQFKDEDKGKYALMRDQKLIGIFPTFRDAYEHALATYDDKNYSFQEIGQEPIELITFPALSA